MKKAFQFKYSFYCPFLNTTNRIHINAGGYYMKHRNMGSTKAKTKTKQLQFSNNDAWKYESYYKYQPLFSYKKIFNFLSQLFRR